MDDLESVLATVTELLSARGDTEGAELLRTAPAHVESTGYDNWNGGTTIWTIYLPIEPAWYARLGDRRFSIESKINEALKSVIGEQTNDWYSVSVCPQRVTKNDWRRAKSGVAEATRRNIVDGLKIEKVDWSGQLNSVEFLSRLWDLKALPSGDGRFKDAEGDIWQHTVNNEDWDDDWIYDDDRFNLLKGPSEVFLKFLCEIVHPVVRPDHAQSRQIVKHINEQLRRDGLELYSAESIAGRPRYANRTVQTSAQLVPSPVSVRQENSMYNLLQVSASGYWDAGKAKFEMDRFLEYTAKPIQERFRPLNDQRVAALKAMPSLFAYEAQCNLPARVGRITEIQYLTNGLALKFEFDAKIPPISPDMVKQLARDLDFEGQEQNRTHWAIKDVDLLKVLADAGVQGATPHGEELIRLAVDMPRFDPTAPKSRVFVVHGRDNSTKHSAARFLERIGVEALILHEQPNAGRTLIMKFQEVAAGADFAVVLVTPDDVGGLDKDNLKRRARQNVIFELGFFIGKLGANKVCALVAGDVEKPSDFDGVVYVPLDSGNGWKLDLARELKAAGIRFDPSKVF